MTDLNEGYEGGCTCGHLRYRVKSAPLIVHCCHCTWCQRQTGTAFAINAPIEADRVELLVGNVKEFSMATPSGKGQTIARCQKCMVAVWGNYYMGGLERRVRFIRAGSLDNPELLPPDIHVFTSAKQPWVVLPPTARAVSVFYDFATTWSDDSLKRRAALFEAAGLEFPK